MSELERKKAAKIKRRKQRLRIILFSFATMIFLLALSLWTIFTVKGFTFLPKKYFIIALVVLGIFNVLLGLIALLPRANNGVKITQSVICTLLAILLLVVNIMIPNYVGRLQKAFVEVPTEGALNINVYTKGDKSYSNVEELAGHKVGYQTEVDTEYQDWAIKVVNYEITGNDIVAIEYEDIYALAEALEKGEVDAILLNESYASILSANDDFEGFEDNNKVIYTCTQMVKLDQVNTADVENIASQPFIVAVTGNDSWKSSTISASYKGRSDVNMILVVNPKTYQVLMLTIPRDSYVAIGGNSSHMDKLTHATTKGMDTWITTLNTLLGIDINYYVRVNFSSMVNIVDALGGIELNNPYYFETKYVYYNGKSTLTKFEEGKISLDGAQALGYCRERKYKISANCTVNDMGRNKHQALVLRGMIKKMCSVSMITKVGDLLEAIEGQFTTNMSTTDMFALAQLQLAEMPEWDIQTYSLSGTTSYETSWIMGRELSMVKLNNTKLSTAKELIQKMMKNEVIDTGEKADSKTGGC